VDEEREVEGEQDLGDHPERGFQEGVERGSTVPSVAFSTGTTP